MGWREDLGTESPPNRPGGGWRGDLGLEEPGESIPPEMDWRAQLGFKQPEERLPAAGPKAIAAGVAGMPRDYAGRLVAGPSIGPAAPEQQPSGPPSPSPIEPDRLPNVIERGEIPPQSSWKAKGARGLRDVFGEKNWAEWLPLAGLGFQLANALELGEAYQYLQDYDKYSRGKLRFEAPAPVWSNSSTETVQTYNKARLEAQQLLEDYILTSAYVSERGTAGYARVAEGLVDAVPYIAGFLATGGLSSSVSGVTKMAARKLLLRFGENKLVGATIKVGENIVRHLATGSLRGALVGWTQVPVEMQKQLASSFRLDENGRIVAKESDVDAATAFLKSLGVVATTYVSEELGDSFNPILRKVLTRFAGLTRVEKTRVAKLVINLLTMPEGEFSQAARFSGLAPEYIEELADSLGQDVLLPDEKEAFKRTLAQLPGGEDFFVTMGVLLGTSGAIGGVQAATEKATGGARADAGVDAAIDGAGFGAAWRKVTDEKAKPSPTVESEIERARTQLIPPVVEAPAQAVAKFEEQRAYEDADRMAREIAARKVEAPPAEMLSPAEAESMLEDMGRAKYDQKMAEYEARRNPQPHEMTAEEFSEAHPQWPAEDRSRQAHRDWVEIALKQKQEVPQEVLAEYPDLATQYRQTILEWKSKPKAKSALKRGLKAIAELQRGDFDVLELTERELNRLVFKKAERVSRIAYREGQKELQAEMLRLRDIALEKLPPGQNQLLAKVMQRVLRVRTPGSIARFTEVLNAYIDRHERKQAELSLKHHIKVLRKTYRYFLPEYMARAKALLAAMPESKPLDASVANAISVLHAVGRDAFGSIPRQVATRAEDVLKRAGKQTLKELSGPELQAFADSIAMLMRQQRLKKKYLLQGRLREGAEIEAQAAFEVRQAGRGKYRANARDKADMGVIRKATWEVGRALTGQDLDITAVAGEDSMMHRLLVEELQQGQGRYMGVATDALLVPVTMARELGLQLDKLADATIDIPLEDTVDEDGRTVPVLETNLDQLMALAAFYFDPENRAEALRNKQHGVHLTGHKVAYKFSPGDWLRILNAIPAPVRAILNQTIEHIGGPLWDAANKAHVELRMYELTRGQYHWPRKRREKRGMRLRPIKYANSITTDDLSIFKERSRSNEPFIIGHWTSTYGRFVHLMAAYAGKAVPAENARNLLRSPDVMRAIQDNHPNPAEFLKDQRELIDEYEGLTEIRETVVDRALKWLTRNLHRGALGLRPQIALYQFISMAQATSEIDAKYLYRSMKKADFMDAEAIAREFSPFLYGRLHGDVHNIITPGSAVASLKRAIGPESLIDTVTMGPIHWMDGQAIRRQIDAALERQLDITGKQSYAELTDAEKLDAMRMAERVVNRTQPSWNPLVTPKIMRWLKDKPLQRTLIMFSSQRAQNFQMMYRAILEYRQGRATFPEMVRKLAVPSLINSLLLAGIYEGVQWLWGALTGDPDKTPQLNNIAWNTIYRTFGNVLILGDFATEFAQIERRVLENKAYYTGGAGNILADTIEAGYRWVSEWSEALSARQPGKNIEEGLRQLIRFQAAFTGLPIEAVSKPLEPFWRMKPRELRKRRQMRPQRPQRQ